MALDYKDLLPTNFDGTSKVWIYQSSRTFTINEALQIEDLLESFVQSWQSHGTPVKGYANLLFGRFIIFIADETATGVSGCSTDSSVRMVKEIEATHKVSLFDRLSLAFVVKDKIETLPLQQIDYAVQNAFITGDTLYFNNTILTLKDLQEKWIVPVKDSWLSAKLLKLHK